jgi:alpha-L-rhamnosidase
MVSVIDLQFEHYHAPNTLGRDDEIPRLSWKVNDPDGNFRQSSYEIELIRRTPGQAGPMSSVIRCTSSDSELVPWPVEKPLVSREKVSIRVKVHDDKQKNSSPWSEPATFETGLLDCAVWSCQRVAAPWGPATATAGPGPEQLYRKVFHLKQGASVSQARLYITAQGVYEAELNGKRIGDYFLAPGWTSYAGRLQYQTYDAAAALKAQGAANCLGVRVAEGWFSGRIGFDGGNRNIWGPHTALLAQLEIQYSDGSSQVVATDGSWTVTKGPIRKAEIYDGEKYDATYDIPLWSSAEDSRDPDGQWEPVLVMAPLPKSTKLVAGYAEPVRRVDVMQPVEKITTPSGKTILDFGQNLVGYLRIKKVLGSRGHRITLRHAEVLEHKELCTRPLRMCDAIDEYTLKGSPEGECYEPRFTFHGFRFAQIDNWPGDLSLDDVEAVVCHTDMASVGDFTCSDPLLNKLYQNVCWSMRDNFLSVPTDCPQRDERLGWSGDLAVFAPTAGLIYDCYNIIKNWLIDLEFDQHVLGGVPPMVSPNSTLPDEKWCRRVPCAIWHDATILVPWALYQETGDMQILAQQYQSMMTWMKVLPRGKERLTHLWDPAPFQLGVSSVLLFKLLDKRLL